MGFFADIKNANEAIRTNWTTVILSGIMCVIVYMAIFAVVSFLPENIKPFLALGVWITIIPFLLYGLSTLFLKIARKESVNFSTMISGFKNPYRVCGTTILYALAFLLGGLFVTIIMPLFIEIFNQNAQIVQTCYLILSIAIYFYLFYTYGFFDFVLYDYPKESPIGVLRLSSDIMSECKFSLFTLDIIFYIPVFIMTLVVNLVTASNAPELFIIMGAIAVIIVQIVLLPLWGVARAQFYDNLCNYEIPGEIQDSDRE